MNRHTIAAAAVLAAVGGAIAAHEPSVKAADHLDPSPRVSLGDAADIADLYAWHGGGNMVAVLTFGGPVAPETTPAFSRDVLYSVHVDGSDDDAEPDQTIRFRFGQRDGSWGVWAEGLPGADADAVGPVGEVIQSGSAQLYAGPREDPFFFDLQGFQETVATGTLAFDGTRDFFAGKNVNAIVVEFPLAELDFEGPYNLWATTARAGG